MNHKPASSLPGLRDVLRGSHPDDIEYAVHACAAYPNLVKAARGALAALSQPKTFPADIEVAKSFLSATLRELGEINGG